MMTTMSAASSLVALTCYVRLFPSVNDMSRLADNNVGTTDSKIQYNLARLTLLLRRSPQRQQPQCRSVQTQPLHIRRFSLHARTRIGSPCALTVQQPSAASNGCLHGGSPLCLLQSSLGTRLGVHYSPLLHWATLAVGRDRHFEQ